jgi:hypothetical protein
MVLAPVALLGFTMLARWIPLYRNAEAQLGPAGSAANHAEAAPERSLPPVVVAGHGVLAVATVILVLLTMLNIGTGAS